MKIFHLFSQDHLFEWEMSHFYAKPIKIRNRWGHKFVLDMRMTKRKTVSASAYH
ncbi:MAG: hypothetical protein Q4C95_02610 [Planctomycetia bacterium]|nr:hypothetical protein [Planctomycetia bacterium]